MKYCSKCGTELNDENTYPSWQHRYNIKICKSCWNVYCAEQKKRRRKETFCKMTGMSRERYLELKEFMGIKI